jgi:ElaB/YqjD/DUF883 family membrane-anchored ribosome-binding protein
METTTGASAVDNAAERTLSSVDRAAQAAHETIDKLAAKAGPAIEKLRSTTTSAGDTLKARADQFGQLEEEWIETSRNYVRENPLTALAIGVLAGVVLAKLASSK